MTLPVTREGRTIKVEIDGRYIEGYLTANVDDEGDPREVFLHGIGKEGSTMYGWTQTVAICFSIGLQTGGWAFFEQVAEKLHEQRFEPYGKTNDPDIPQVNSVPDYIVRRLALWFGSDKLIARLNE